MATFALTVNGRAHRVEAPADETLLSVLRNRLDLTGTKYGCGEGQCGACSVLVGGEVKRSCRLPISEAAGKEVTTIEGLATGERLHPVQQAFLDREAFQCGFCTPGMIVAAAGLLRKKPDPAEEDIRASLASSMCRCCVYPRIVEAVKDAARAAKASKA